MRKRIKVEHVSSSTRYQNLINRTTFKYLTTYNENVSTVTSENKIINLCKLIYISKYFIQYLLFLKMLIIYLYF